MSLNTILKRSRCISSTTKSRQNIRYDSITEMAHSKNTHLIPRLAENYVDGLMCKEGADHNYGQAINLLSYYNENNIPSDKLYSKIVEMTYYIENLEGFKEKVKYAHISDEYKKSLTELANDLVISDRILTNYKSLNEKFDFENNIQKIQHKNASFIISEIRKMLSQYKFKPYQEMNVMMEQIGFIKEKDKLKLPHNIYENIFEYYSVRVDDSERFNLIRVMKESSIVPDEVKADVNDKLERLGAVEDVCTSINTMLNSIYLNGKDSAEYNHMLYHTFKNTSVTDICTNLSKIFDFFENIKTDVCPLSDLIHAVKAGIKDKELNYAELDEIDKALIELGHKYPAYVSQMQCLIHDLKNKVYSTENIKAIIAVSQEGVTISLDEFKLFKFKGGLIKVVHNLDKYLAGKEKELIAKLKKKAAPVVNKATAILFGEASYMEENIYSYIGLDNKVDVCVRQYELNESNSDIMMPFLHDVIKEFNYNLDINNFSNIRTYYQIVEGIAEVRVKDNTILQLTDEQSKLVRNSSDPSMDLYVEMVDNLDNLYEEYSDLPIMELKKLASYDTIRECMKMDDEAFLALVEALRYLDTDVGMIEDVITAYNDIKYEQSLMEDGVRVDENLIKNTLLSWERVENVPPAIALEAFEIVCTIISETSKAEVLNEASSVYDHAKQNGYTWDDDEDEEEEDEKPAKKEEAKKKPTEKPSKMYGKGEELPKGDEKKKTSFNLNSAILAAKGLAGKVKHYTGKAAETINNLEHAMTSTINAIKKADSDERRERIIKGSVIPGFKKCLNLGVLLVSLGIATGGVVAPIIAAIGGFALDKKLTKKEKLLILDEIDTEIEVIDKELAIADQNNQLNKYRALLKYKKDLQRQYQRIRYNIRVGQDTAYFSSDVGMQRKG